MRALVWIGLILLALGLLAYVVFRITIWFAGLLLVAGLVAIVWGAIKARSAVRH